MTVAYHGQVSNAFTVPVAASAPSVFTLNQAGWGQAAAINAVDGTANTAANPRHQFNAGLQQAFGRHLLLDADYFWKYTNSAYEYSTLLNTTITFPISWHNSKLDGVTGRLISAPPICADSRPIGPSGTHARYFLPEVGGLISQGAPLAAGVFRIDHDQALQSTTVFRYQHKTHGWVSLIRQSAFQGVAAVIGSRPCA